jgi:hypothetical protein
MLMRGRRRRRPGGPGGKARGGGALEAGEESAEQEDGEEADTRSMGIKSPGGWGGSGSKPPAFLGPTTVDRRRGGGVRALAGRWTADFGRPAAAENPVGQRTRGRRGRRQSGRMTSMTEEDTTTTMAVDQG